MAIQTYGLSPGRIDKYKGEILKHAVPRECLSRFGRQVTMPKNSSDTYVARRSAALWCDQHERHHYQPVLPERGRRSLRGDGAGQPDLRRRHPGAGLDHAGRLHRGHPAVRLPLRLHRQDLQPLRGRHPRRDDQAGRRARHPRQRADQLLAAPCLHEPVLRRHRHDHRDGQRGRSRSVLSARS